MRLRSTKDVCSTRLRRVQFGVPPNCIRAYAFSATQTANDALCLQTVSGATPETTRETQVLHNKWSPHPAISLAEN
jgi:hypothetical protein